MLTLCELLTFQLGLFRLPEEPFSVWWVSGLLVTNFPLMGFAWDVPISPSFQRGIFRRHEVLCWSSIFLYLKISPLLVAHGSQFLTEKSPVHLKFTLFEGRLLLFLQILLKRSFWLSFQHFCSEDDQAVLLIYIACGSRKFSNLSFIVFGQF